MLITTNTEIQSLKVKRTLNELSTATGDATSLITVMIASGGSISKTKQKLVSEESTSSQIKSRV
jgi:peptide subunit release factor 1 (eRF1)